MPAAFAVSALLVLGACSGDDSDGDKPESGESPAAVSESPTIYPIDGCEAVVKVSGALKVAWKGDGQVAETDEATMYQTQDGKKSWIAVTASNGEAPSQVVVTVDGTTYAVPAKGVKIEKTDDGVVAKAAIPVDKESAKLQATFTCA